MEKYFPSSDIRHNSYTSQHPKQKSYGPEVNFVRQFMVTMWNEIKPQVKKSDPCSLLNGLDKNGADILAGKEKPKDDTSLSSLYPLTLLACLLLPTPMGLGN